MANYLFATGKSPDNMNRNEMIKAIRSIDSRKEAELFWLKWCGHRVSRSAFLKARS